MPSALSYAPPMDGFTSARRFALSSAAVLLLAACDTARQEAALPAPPPPRPGTAPPAPTGLSAWRIGELIGRTVYNRDGQAVGVVDDVVVHRRDRTTAAVLRMGGFLWFGGDVAVVPVRQLRLQGDTVVAPNLTREVLERVDNYQARDWDSADRDRLVGAAR
jgi:sporulation protein YlmC with PRC-barrel domain